MQRLPYYGRVFRMAVSSLPAMRCSTSCLLLMPNELYLQLPPMFEHDPSYAAMTCIETCCDHYLIMAQRKVLPGRTTERDSEAAAQPGTLPNLTGMAPGLAPGHLPQELCRSSGLRFRVSEFWS